MKKIILLAVTGILLTSCSKGTTEEPKESAGTLYSIEEVAKHSTAEDCWLAIDGKVYDVTGWNPKHPGGADLITQSCGKDGSDAYHTKGDAGREHSLQAKRLLDEYYVGDLK